MSTVLKAKNRWERLGLAAATVVGSNRGGAAKPATPPSKLRLSEVTLDARLRVRPVDENVASEYAENIDELPAATVWLVGEIYLLVDGWHRYRAHEMAGAAHIRVVVMNGSYDRAMLFVAGVDKHVGLPRSREAKRAAVQLALATSNAAAWSDRELAKHCGVSHTFVAQLRRRGATGVSEADVESDAAAPQKCRQSLGRSESGGNVAIQVDHEGAVATPSCGNVAGLDGRGEGDAYDEHDAGSPSSTAPVPPLLTREVEVTEADSIDVEAARKRLRGEGASPPGLKVHERSQGQRTGASAVDQQSENGLDFHLELPSELERRLQHLAVDRDTAVADLVVEGVVLLLRYYGHGEGLPEPAPPRRGHHDES